MQIFITGTDTNVGKTVVSSWLCLHSRYDYYKPIQTGAIEGTDSQVVRLLTNARTYPETYIFQAPVSPHEAAMLENSVIDMYSMTLPKSDNLIIEGAGGVLVPISPARLFIDLIQYMQVPVILVTASKLGMINHTLLSLEALRLRSIEVLGVIINGLCSPATVQAITSFGNTKILAHLPHLPNVSGDSLGQLSLSSELRACIQEL